MGWDKFEKLVELVKRRITNIVLYTLKDPRMGFITITKIDLSRDLKDCKVFYTVFGTDAEKSKTTHALKDARGFIQREVGKTLRTRTIPHLQFYEDGSFDKLNRVQEIFQVLEEEKMENEPVPDSENDPIPDSDEEE